MKWDNVCMNAYTNACLFVFVASINLGGKVNVLFTCSEVMDAAWPSSTASGAEVCRHHTLIILSQLPAASRVFS